MPILLLLTSEPFSWIGFILSDIGLLICRLLPGKSIVMDEQTRSRSDELGDVVPGVVPQINDLRVIHRV